MSVFIPKALLVGWPIDLKSVWSNAAFIECAEEALPIPEGADRYACSLSPFLNAQPKLLKLYFSTSPLADLGGDIITAVAEVVTPPPFVKVAWVLLFIVEIVSTKSIETLAEETVFAGGLSTLTWVTFINWVIWPAYSVPSLPAPSILINWFNGFASSLISSAAKKEVAVLIILYLQK